MVLLRLQLLPPNLNIVFEICQQIMNLFIIYFQVAHAHIILNIALPLVHLVKEVLNGQIANAQILQPFKFLLITFLIGIPTRQSAILLAFRELPKHRVRLSRPSLPVGKASHVVTLEQLRYQRL